jgi:hypothetical protein
VRFLSGLMSTAVLTALLAFPASATVWAQEDLQVKLVSIEESLWEGWKNKDAKPFEKSVADDSVNINVEGITSGKAKLIKDITTSDCDVRSFSLADVAVHRLGKNSAMLTCKAAQDATCKGQKVAAEVYVSAVYVNQDGTWKSVSYQETPAIPATK